MALAYDVMVIPHGSSVYSYHLQYAFTNCPMAEYICLSEQVGLRICTCTYIASTYASIAMVATELYACMHVFHF